MSLSSDLALKQENSAVASMQNAQNLEQIITGLEKQNQFLLQGMEKAVKVFQKKKEERDKTIATLAKSNEELSAALIAAENRNQEQSMLHEANRQADQEKHNQQIALLKKEFDKIVTQFKIIDSYFTNLPILQEYKNLNALAAQNEYVFLLLGYQQRYEQLYGAPLRAIQERMDENYKHRTNEPIEVFTAEAAAQTPLIKNGLQTIKEEFERK